MENTEERKNANCHTISELEAAGNRQVLYNEHYLSMKRGDTLTVYNKKEYKGKIYWTPVIATTL